MRGVRGATRAHARPCDRARRRGSWPPRSTSAASSAPAGRSAWRPSTAACPPTRRSSEVAERSSASTRTPPSAAILLQLPLPGAPRRPELTGADRPRQGRRRAHAGQRRAARRSAGRACALHAARRDRAAARGAGRAGGRRSGRGRPLQPVRQADGAAAADANATVTICHSRTRDLRGGLRARRRADRGRRAPRMVEGDFVKPGAIVIDVGMNRLTRGGGQQERTRRRRRLRRRRSSPARSLRCPAASGR